MKGRFRLAIGLLCTFWGAPGRCEAPDSVQIRGYQGLDEMGASAAFSIFQRWGSSWSSWQGQASDLYRRPPSSQGDFRSEGKIRGEWGVAVVPKLDLRAIFEGSHYRFDAYAGPKPLVLNPQFPSSSWQIAEPIPSSPSPAQRISSPYLGLGAIFRPDSAVSISLEAGRRWDQREGFQDNGVSAALGAEIVNAPWGGSLSSLKLFAQGEELGARSNRELRLNGGLEKQFSSSSSDHFSVVYHQKRHDYHIWGMGSIGTRLDIEDGLQNLLRYNLSPQVGFLFDTQIGGSRHEDRTSTASAARDETNAATALSLRSTFETVAGWVRWRLDWAGQEDATGLKRERGISLEEGLDWKIAATDSLSLVTAVRKRQYDTSDSANYDDRDRLRYEAELTYSRSFSPSFRFSHRIEAILEHLVYIYGQKSDQNNWNRIFKLGPEIYSEPFRNWHNTTRFELVANYTDYDFDLDPAAIKSTVYRRYSAQDSLTCSLPRGWMITTEYALDLEDGGRLLWDDWIEQIADEYRTHKGSLQIGRETRTGSRFAAGLSAYQRRGWQNAVQPDGQNAKAPFLLLWRWGPNLQATYFSAARLRVDASGELSYVHQWGSDDYTIVNLDLRLTWN